ncbi:PaaI family thioesterase [Streptomyces acidiscabies]|uniref:Acyl-coenzyme A thioesterase THEM4 n=1 Tax=Streptomyces acidiscabies TaxID=42234 RepID=A0AAP6BHW5_9ACTN|nr:PaaI family thioesterase [Streptomyces acidiscabies]MBP5934975.1 PaaI family thioesterase [Streptomyces sp. LBUM 1476]MBZ3917252.1 PaaI family thioesterase [Streptomyces acidiscabies]MDX2964777.1 PaaI family thioesterase [Streptomyces acidiscabies]MDX3023278.1 PaaI family thioesterase [Streptomyces acidiscabies]MDX3795919.1 PaaI family thioesterase [Streptomyces acidiscabies]
MSAPPTPTPTHDLTHHRAAISTLGHDLRALVDATVASAAPPETLHRVAEAVRDLTTRFTGPRRTPAEIPSVDEFPGTVRMFSPVIGEGNPLAPPVRLSRDGDGVVGLCTLGLVHEGPPGYGHGGFTAMLLDELMGHACVAAGRPGMTVSLTTRYHRPVPLETPLRIHARVTGVEGRKVFATGTVSTAEDPATPLADGEAMFVTPDPDQARAMFPHLRADR